MGYGLSQPNRADSWKRLQLHPSHVAGAKGHTLQRDPSVVVPFAFFKIVLSTRKRGLSFVSWHVPRSHHFPPLVSELNRYALLLNSWHGE